MSARILDFDGQLLHLRPDGSCEFRVGNAATGQIVRVEIAEHETAWDPVELLGVVLGRINKALAALETKWLP